MPSDQIQYTIFINWIAYFVLGILLAEKKKFFSPQINALLVVVGFIGSFTYSYFTADQTKNIVRANRFTKIPVFFYSVGLIGLFLQDNFQPLNQTRLLSWLGKNSYLIFKFTRKEQCK